MICLPTAIPKETGERYDRKQWQSMRDIMSDTPKFVEILYNLSWQEGLETNVLASKLLPFTLPRSKSVNWCNLINMVTSEVLYLAVGRGGM